MPEFMLIDFGAEQMPVRLGLSIARGMARMHGGDVTLENRPEGGLKATATFKRS